MSGIDIIGVNTDWETNVKIHTLDSVVIGNNVATPDTDGDSNKPLRHLANRTARIKYILDMFGMYPTVSEFTHSGQNVIYNAPIRGDVVDGNLVSFNTNQYWNLDLSQTDSRNILIGVADKTNSRVITGGLITISGFNLLGFTEGDLVYANPTTPGAIRTDISSLAIGQYIFDDVIRINIMAIDMSPDDILTHEMLFYLHTL
jgi:hypothetical protein